MNITVNGKTRLLEGTITIDTLLADLKMDSTRVAIELNRAILPRDRFADTSLQNGDTLEIVQFVGGG